MDGEATAAQPALAGITVIEVSCGFSAAYCAWLLATYGARVIVVEPSAGHRLRHIDRVGAHEAGPGAGGPFLTYGRGKESVELDITTEDGRASMEQLLAGADVLVGDCPEQLAGAGLSWERLHAAYPQLVVASMTPFGEDGPYAGYAALPGVVYALAGYTYLTGDPEREPLTGPENIPAFFAGVNACTGILSALRVRERVGGQRVQVSELESLASAHQWTLARCEYNGRVQTRNNSRYDSLHPVAFYDCADGTIAASPSLPDQVERMLALMGMSELLEDERFHTNFGRVQNADAFDAAIQPWFDARTREEIAREFQAFRVPCAPALEIDELLAHPQLEARGFWVRNVTAAGEELRFPLAPFRLPLSPANVRAAPELGMHDELPARTTGRQTDAAAVAAAGPPLAGVRILDLTRVWSGPLATRILADLGAEVIKVEHPVSRGPAEVRYADAIRVTFYPDCDPGEDPYNRNAAFNKLNRNKKSVTLDLGTPEGHAAMCGLVEQSDVVIENYSPRVMGNLGLGYDTLSRLNPGTILVSMPGYGLDGPLRDGVAYGTTLDAESGVVTLMGYEGEGPARLGVALPDPVAGLHAAAAVLTALHQRERVGLGQHIDLSQLESMTCFVADAVTDWQVTGERHERKGNRHPSFAPHGVYACREQNSWVFVGVASEDQWRVLARVIGDRDLAMATEAATAAGRRALNDRIEPLLARWCAERTHLDAMRELQAEGVPAGAVLSAADMLQDPHLKARGFFVTLTHPSCGTHRYAGQAIRMSSTPAVFRTDAPLLGEHNVEMLGGLLGYSTEKLDELRAAGIIAERPPA